MAESAKQTPSLLRIRDVSKKTGLGRSLIYARIKDGNFPAPIKISNCTSSFWSSVEVQGWVDEQLEAAKAG